MTKMHLVTYDDTKFSATKMNSFVHEKKLLAIKHSLRYWFYYIDNQYKIVILIDDQNLKYLKTMKNSSKRLTKEIFEFSEYNLKIKYCKKFEAVVLNVIFRKFVLIKRISINRTFFLAMIKKIDE